LFKRARAFCPAGVTSFFEICDHTPDGKLIIDPERIGARGGGFALKAGVSTEVAVDETEENKVQVFINGELCPEAETTKKVVEMLTAQLSAKHDITVKHIIEVPVGAGFGSSAAGALGTALALNKTLHLNLTYNQLGRVAHVAEVKCKTGLGTAAPLLFGGFPLSLEPGAPGIGCLDRIPLSNDYIIIAGTFRPYPTKEVLSSQEKREEINAWGQKTLQKILEEPSPKNFMASCKQFAIETGFATERVKKLIELCENAGAVGATQNMLGEAVHALVKVNKIERVHDAFRKLLPENQITLSDIDFQGARLTGLSEQ
jgi:pantoate kinase